MDNKNLSNIKVFLDTNMIEAYHEESCLTLHTIKLHSNFYKVLEICKDIPEVKVCIPEIVWKEVCVHLTTNFSSTMQSMRDKINLYKKTFGDLFEINVDTKGYTKENYPAYLEQISKEFWSSVKDRCELVAFKKSDTALLELVDKALSKRKPFTKAQAKKEYSDAGFKDAVIVETILSSCADSDIAIFLTNDHDFNEVFKQYDVKKYIAVKSIEELKKQIDIILDRNDKYIVKSIFEENSYIKETLFSFVGLIFDESTTVFIVDNVERDDELYQLTIRACVNETNYNMSVKYDFVANEIIDVHYEISND